MFFQKSFFKIYPFSFLILLSCTNFSAYFNTFYNAQELFRNAEEIRQKSEDDKPPKTALDNYQKVIDKSNYILDQYPDVKYRKDALLLILQSHFHRQEYLETKNILSKLIDEFGDNSLIEYNYWSSMVKWKEGKAQPAINGMLALFDFDINTNLESKIYLSIAEIYFEQKINDKSMDYLELAAQKIKDRSEKGQLYFRIAELSFDQKDYQRSVEAYKQTIKNSQIKKRVQASHLKIVQIYRLQNLLELASSTIKNMLIDESFQAIYPALELELSKLYSLQGMEDEALSRLNNILKDYPKTLEAAEASYIIAEYNLKIKSDFESALKYYASVKSENRSSLFIKSSDVKIREINAYLKLKKDYNAWNTTILSDTLESHSSDNTEKISKMLYELAELNALHFSQIDSAMVYLDQLIGLNKRSKLLSKALYTKATLLENISKGEKANFYKKRIVDEFPQSDYAFAIISNDSTLISNQKTSQDLLLNAEKTWSSDRFLALNIYKEIVNNDTVSQSGLKAAYFLAYNYDYTFVYPDSAKKFYAWIMKYHLESEQAKLSKKRLAAIAMLTKAELSKN